MNLPFYLRKCAKKENRKKAKRNVKKRWKKVLSIVNYFLDLCLDCVCIQIPTLKHMHGGATEKEEEEK